MGGRSVRKACAAKLRALTLRSPLDIQALCDQLQEARGRPITLMALRGLEAGGPCGIWLATPGTDFVLHRDDTSPLHQTHIILHELSHLIFEHTHGLEGDYLRLLLPNLGATAVRRILQRSAYTVRRILQRSAYTVREEREAETLATLLTQRIARAPRESDDGRPEGPGRYQRLQRLLE